MIVFLICLEGFSESRPRLLHKAAKRQPVLSLNRVWPALRERSRRIPELRENGPHFDFSLPDAQSFPPRQMERQQQEGEASDYRSIDRPGCSSPHAAQVAGPEPRGHPPCHESRRPPRANLHQQNLRRLLRFSRSAARPQPAICPSVSRRKGLNCAGLGG